MAVLGPWHIWDRLPPSIKYLLGEANAKIQELDGVTLTNSTGLPMRFLVEATDPDVNYEIKPSRGIVPPSGTRRINLIARGLPLLEQRKEKTVDFTFKSTLLNIPDAREEDIARVFREEDIAQVFREEGIAQVFREEYYTLRLQAPDQAIPYWTTFQCVVRVRLVHPKIEVHILMKRAAKKVLEENLEAAVEIFREAIDLHPDGYLLLCHALVNQLLDRKEEVQLALQEAGRLFSISESTGGTGENFGSSETYRIISTFAKVPTYTEEKLCGKQMIVDWRVAVTENQQLDVEVRLTPFNMLRPDGNVEVIVIVDSLRFEVRSEKTGRYSDHFLQSLRMEVRPAGKWSESFSKGFGLIKWSPGNELNVLSVQQGSSLGFTGGVNLGAFPSAGLHFNRNNTSGVTFSAFGLKKSARDGHAYVCEYQLRAFEDGTSAQNLRGRRCWKNPKVPEDVRDGVNYSNLGKDASFAGTWRVPYATAIQLWNELEFTIFLEAKLPVLKCRKSSLTHLLNPPEHKPVVKTLESRRICVFAMAGLKSFIAKSM